MSDLSRVGRSVAAARGLDLADLEGQLDWERFGRACRDAMARLRPCPSVDAFLPIPSSSGEVGAISATALQPAPPPSTAVQSVAAPLPSPSPFTQPREAVVVQPVELQPAPSWAEASAAAPGGVATSPGHTLIEIAWPEPRRVRALRRLAAPAAAGLIAVVAVRWPLAAAAGSCLAIGPALAGLALRGGLEPEL